MREPSQFHANLQLQENLREKDFYRRHQEKAASKLQIILILSSSQQLYNKGSLWERVFLMRAIQLCAAGLGPGIRSWDWVPGLGPGIGPRDWVHFFLGSRSLKRVSFLSLLASCSGCYPQLGYELKLQCKKTQLNQTKLNDLLTLNYSLISHVTEPELSWPV